MRPVFGSFIIRSDHDAYSQLVLDREKQKSEMFTGFDDRLYMTINDDGGIYFVELNWDEKDPRDPTGHYGKYRYLNEPTTR